MDERQEIIKVLNKYYVGEWGHVETSNFPMIEQDLYEALRLHILHTRLEDLLDVAQHLVDEYCVRDDD